MAVAGLLAAAATVALLAPAVAPVPALADSSCTWRLSTSRLLSETTGLNDRRTLQLRELLAASGAGTAGFLSDAGCSPAPGSASSPSSVPPQPTPPAQPDTTGPATSASAVPEVRSVPSGGTNVCDKFGSTPVTGGYEVQNNVWGSDRPQCVRAFDTGFAVEGAHFTNNAGPASYPSIFTGCHYGTCTTGTTLPRQISALPPVSSSWSFQAPTDQSRWVAAYDIWFDPTARRTDTVTGTEMMIWLDATGPQPIGQKTATVTIAGATWDVWRGVNGAQVISYVRTTPTRHVSDLPLSAFFTDARTRGVVRDDWYLTSIQAGFEPWTGGAGLATTHFAVTGTTPPTGTRSDGGDVGQRDDEARN